MMVIQETVKNNSNEIETDSNIFINEIPQNSNQENLTYIESKSSYRIESDHLETEFQKLKDELDKQRLNSQQKDFYNEVH